MGILLLGALWTAILLWMMIQQKVYLRARNLDQGIDRKGSAFGGLIPLSFSGLLLGLTLAWLGVFNATGLIGLALLTSWALNQLQKPEEILPLPSPKRQPDETRKGYLVP